MSDRGQPQANHKEKTMTDEAKPQPPAKNPRFYTLSLGMVAYYLDHLDKLNGLPDSHRVVGVYVVRESYGDVLDALIERTERDEL